MIGLMYAIFIFYVLILFAYLLSYEQEDAEPEKVQQKAGARSCQDERAQVQKQKDFSRRPINYS